MSTHSPRPRAANEIVKALLLVEHDADNQPIADAVRELGYGVSFTRISRLRKEVRASRRKRRAA